MYYNYCANFLLFSNSSKINVSYQFLDKSVVHTDSLPYSCVLAWNSSNVLLLGTIVPELLLEYLRGPPLIFEMHIQNIGEVESVNTKGRSEAAVFGQLIHDQVLGTCKCNGMCILVLVLDIILILPIKMLLMGQNTRIGLILRPSLTSVLY